MKSLKGDEMFRLQKHLYKHCGGLLGVTENQKTIIAIVLDTAYALGAISEANIEHENDYSKLIFDKMKRLGIDLNEAIFK